MKNGDNLILAMKTNGGEEGKGGSGGSDIDDQPAVGGGYAGGDEAGNKYYLQTPREY